MDIAQSADKIVDPGKSQACLRTGPIGVLLSTENDAATKVFLNSYKDRHFICPERNCQSCGKGHIT